MLGQRLVGFRDACYLLGRMSGVLKAELNLDPWVVSYPHSIYNVAPSLHVSPAWAGDIEKWDVVVCTCLFRSTTYTQHLQRFVISGSRLITHTMKLRSIRYNYFGTNDFTSKKSSRFMLSVRIVRI